MIQLSREARGTPHVIRQKTVLDRTKGRLSWVGHSLRQEDATRLALGQLAGAAAEASEASPWVGLELRTLPTLVARHHEGSDLPLINCKILTYHSECIDM